MLKNKQSDLLIETTINTLERVKAKLLSGWTKKVYARDSHGREVLSSSPAACSWCLLGAVNACCSSIEAEFVLEQLRCELDKISPKSFLFKFNDGAESVDEVIHLIDKTIARLKLEKHDA